MNEVINITLPSPLAKSVKAAVKTGLYASASDFFRDLLKDWQKGKLLSALKESRAEIVAGKGKILRSLKALR